MRGEGGGGKGFGNWERGKDGLRQGFAEKKSKSRVSGRYRR